MSMVLDLRVRSLLEYTLYMLCDFVFDATFTIPNCEVSSM